MAKCLGDISDLLLAGQDLADSTHGPDLKPDEAFWARLAPDDVDNT